MKEVSLKNHNNKFANDIFIHIAASPGPILESDMPILTTISTNTGQKFKANLIDVARCELSELNSITTYMSHGKSRNEFIDYYLSIPGKKANDKVAIFIFQKCSNGNS